MRLTQGSHRAQEFIASFDKASVQSCGGSVKTQDSKRLNAECHYLLNVLFP